MKKYFNTNGVCYPNEHYMVNLDKRLAEIELMVDRGQYFVINRARQYGKTTILQSLKRHLSRRYIVISLNFQKMSSDNFKNEQAFSMAFAKAFLRETHHQLDADFTSLVEMLLGELIQEAGQSLNLTQLFEILSDICSKANAKVILMIDEVDHASNNQVFLDFLAQLRAYYLDRSVISTFQSVILAGVYDIKNLKGKYRSEDIHRYNSPWNIATNFDMDLSFSPEDIAGMLKEYETEENTGMDITNISELIYNYTSGYPFLVSRICKLLDETIVKKEGFDSKASAWTETGITEAVKEILKESNTLFDDMRKKITDYPELRQMIYYILFNGQSFSYNPDNFVIDIGMMFGFITEHDGQVIVSNRIFETRLYNFFLSEEMLGNMTYQAGERDKNQFVKDGMLDMDLVMKRFMQHFTDIYGDSSDKFIEDNGRRYFLLYLKPIINGSGNYYVEAQTRDQTRTDIIVDYKGQQFVIELKIWRGDKYLQSGEKQLLKYLEQYHLSKGYLLCFSFNKNKNTGIREVQIENKKILEVIV